MEFDVESGYPLPEGQPWEPVRPKKNSTWPFVYMRVNQSFPVLDLHTAKMVYSRMRQYMDRNPDKSFLMYEVVPDEIYRCYRVR